jgi:ribosomal protein S27E
MGKQETNSLAVCKMQNALLEYPPQIGDIKGSKELGKNYRGRFQYVACPQCGNPHWVALSTLHDQRCEKGLCRSCVSSRIAKANKYRINTIENRLSKSLRMRGKNNPAWKGGKFKTHGGYIELYLHPDDFYCAMANERHRVKEHRLVMAKSLGRCLHTWEIVHHKNHIKDDNRIENLQLVTDDRHKQISIMEQRIQRLQRDNLLLKKYIVSLGDEVLCNAPIAIRSWI